MKTLAAIIVCIWLALLPAGAQNLLSLAGGPQGTAGESVTQDFNAYTAGVQLSTLPGWRVPYGSFITGSGGVASDVASVYSAAGYAPAGFTIAPNHEVEGVVYETVGGADTYQGISCAFQPNGDSYLLMYGSAGYLYFWPWNENGVAGDALFIALGAIPPGGLKLRLTVTGTGESRRVTASYDLNAGAGWVTPAGWANKDFGPGKRWDGGKGGIVGLSNTHTMWIDSLTIRNLPPDGATEVTEGFDFYTPGVQLATLPWWTVVPAGVGKFITGAGGVSSDVASDWSKAVYSPAGFAISPDHEVEGMVYELGGATNQGIACAMQPNGYGYFLTYGAGGNLYFWDWIGWPGLTVGIDLINPNGLKLRLTVTGAGETRRVTASYDRNEGAGWVTPAGWLNRDFGPGLRYDGGKGGIAGYNNTHNIKIDSLTIRNLPQTEVTQNFDSYTAGVSLATLPGWTIFGGSWKVGTSTVYSDTVDVFQTAKYDPPGFVVSPNHEAEMTIAGAVDGDGLAVVAALQADGSGYAVDTDGANVYFGRITPGGGGFADYVSADTPGIGTGSKLRISVTGAGESRRVTGSFASGGGWVTPDGWLNKDFGTGKRYDGGTGGLSGYSNRRFQEAADLTIRNLPPDPPPPPTAGLLGWWKADSVAQADNTAVATWQDSHTTDKDMQTAGAAQPTLQTNEMNGRPVLRFDGVDDALVATMPITGSTVTAYIVLKEITMGNRIAAFSADGETDYGNDASAILGYFLDATNLQCYRNGAKAFVSRPASGIAFVYTAVWDGTNNTAFVNGTAGAPVASTGPFGGAYLYAGSGNTIGNTPAGFSNIDLAEFLIYGAAHDATTRHGILTYLSQKWGTPPPP